MITEMSRSIGCPVPWCTGLVGDHGGYGDEPEDWAHSDCPGTPLPLGWTLTRWQVGSGAPVWELAADGAEVLRSSSPAQLAAQLAAITAAIEGVSS